MLEVLNDGKVDELAAWVFIIRGEVGGRSIEAEQASFCCGTLAAIRIG